MKAIGIFSKTLLALVFFASISATAFAEDPNTQTAIEIAFDKQFQVMDGTVAKLVSEGITIQVDKVNVPKPVKCDAANGENCPQLNMFLPSVDLVVSKEYGESETTPVAATKINITYGNSAEAFGIKISNLTISYNEEKGAGTAMFIVKKAGSDSITAKVGEKFTLGTGATASVFDTSKTPVMAITLNNILMPKCIEPRSEGAEIGTKCIGGQPIASVTIASGKVMNVNIEEGKSVDFGPYTVSFLKSELVIGAEKSKGVFLVAKKPIEEKIKAKLDEKFSLKPAQWAVLIDTPIEIRNDGVIEVAIACEAGKECIKPKPRVSLTIVDTSRAIINYGAKANSAVPTKAAENQKIAVPETKPGVGPSQRISLAEGESKEAFGYKFTAHSVGPETVLSASKSDTQPEIIKANLNEKFKAGTGQTAVILENGSEAIRLRIDGFAMSACSATSNQGEKETNDNIQKKCDLRTAATITASRLKGDVGVSTNLFIREGDESLFDGYSIRFIDFGGQTGVFVVSKASEDFKEVKIGEKFNLVVKETALVSGKGVFITLRDVVASGCEPQVDGKEICKIKKVAEVAVRPKFQKTASEYGPGEDKMRTYRLSVGQSLNLYGLNITLLGALPLDDPQSAYEPNATFVVTESGSQEINVRLGDTFKLQQNYVANVLDADMRITLIEASSSEQCQACTQTDSEKCTSDCINMKYVTLAVDRVFSKPIPMPEEKPTEARQGSVSGSEMGKVVQAIAEKVIAKVAPMTGNVVLSNSPKQATDKPDVSTSATPQIVSAKRDYLPKPIDSSGKVISISEGETANLGDYEIKAVSISTEGKSAELTVMKKSTGKTFTIEVKPKWNLISLPGKTDQVGSNNCDPTNWTLYKLDGGKFVKIKDSPPGNALWLYNPGKGCTAKMEIREPTPISQLSKLNQGWNFVAIVPEMMGSKITDFGCKVKAAYQFNAASQNWQKQLTETINPSDLGKGLAVNVTEECTLAGTSTVPAPPELPPIESPEVAQ